MTGFGRHVDEGEAATVAVEVRSVNNRSLKLITRTSDAIASAAHKVEERVRSRIGRGTVTVTVSYRERESTAAADIDEAALEKAWERVSSVAKRLGSDEPIRLEALLAVPGVIVDRGQLLGLEPDEAWSRIEATVDGALDRFITMRAREGAALEADLRKHLDLVDQGVAAAHERAPEASKEYGERFRQRVATVLGSAGVKVEEPELLRELAFYAERSDTSEEIQRLTSHVEQFRAALDSEEPVGRKLEFVAQEMLREANTIGSKCNDAPGANVVVDLKLEIDRIREQVLNVE